MAVKRQGNWLGQQRVDAPHLRAVESGVAGDFDALAGKALAGGNALILSGFTLSNTTVGQPTSNLLLNVASGVMLHATAAEAGTIFTVDVGVPAEAFVSTNPNISGSFAPSTTNYIALNLIRQADVTSTDVVRFLSTATNAEYTQTVPLARTLKYVIVVSTSDFNANPSLIPIAKVVTDASNNIASAVVDCRQLMFRLGTGGTSPVAKATYAWADTSRNEHVSDLAGIVFAGGDKGIKSQYEWNRAVMSRLWELGGGEYWYSPTADRNVKMNGNPSATFAGGENFEWNAVAANNLHWQGLRLVFPNSTGWYNAIADQLVDNPGGGSVYGAGFTDLTLDGDCIYVDVDRTQNLTGVQAYKGNLSNLGLPTIPGSRFVIAWRSFNKAWSLLSPFAIGSSGVIHATVAAYGSVKLGAAGGSVTDAVSPGYDFDSLTVIAGRLSRFNNAPQGVGAGALLIGTVGAFDTSLTFASTGVTSTFQGAVVGQQGFTVSNSLANGYGVKGTGNGTGNGVWGIGGSTAGTYGGYFTGGSGGGGGVYGAAVGNYAGASFFGGTGNDTDGVVGNGMQAGRGVYGIGGATSGVGVYGVGGSTGGIGVSGHGTGPGSGVYGIGGFTDGSYGVYGTSNATNSIGVYGLGKGTGSGVYGFGGATGGIGTQGQGAGIGPGLYGVGGATAGAYGVHGVGGSGGGEGGRFEGTGAFSGVEGSVGPTGLYGVYGDGSTATTNGTGVAGLGKGTGNGGYFTGGNNGGVSAVYGQGGTSNGIGVTGFATGTAYGVQGSGGPTDGSYGVFGTSQATNGGGVRGQGKGTYAGVYGASLAVGDSGNGVSGVTNGSGTGVEGVSSGTGYGGMFTGNATRSALRLSPATADPSTPAEGDIYYNTTTKHFFGYVGAGGWKQLDN